MQKKKRSQPDFCGSKMERESEFLVETFNLAFGLSVITGGEADVDFEVLTECQPYSGGPRSDKIYSGRP